jgi:hypothetical protein
MSDYKITMVGVYIWTEEENIESNNFQRCTMYICLSIKMTQISCSRNSKPILRSQEEGYATPQMLIGSAGDSQSYISRWFKLCQKLMHENITDGCYSLL